MRGGSAKLFRKRLHNGSECLMFVNMIPGRKYMTGLFDGLAYGMKAG
jgi:hypothetical protein